MFGQELKGKVPSVIEDKSNEDVHREVINRDSAKKQQWKAYGDNHRNVCNSQIEMGSREHVAKLYDATRNNVMHELKNGMDFYAATMNMWSSHGMTPYIGFTLHWIDNEWVLQNRCLGMKYVPEEHTGLQLACCLDEILTDWRLDEKKMAAITTDNGANIVKACRVKQWPNTTCFGHNLHLAITTTIEKQPNVSRAIRVCKKTVAAFNMSWKRKKALSEAQLL